MSQLYANMCVCAGVCVWVCTRVYEVRLFWESLNSWTSPT